MPDVILYVDAVTERELAPYFEELGKALRQATIDTLPGDMTLADVAVMSVSHTHSSNASRMQIVGIASHTEEREKKLDAWAIALSEAWQNFASKHNIPWKDKVDVWPQMPQGKWMRATSEAIAKMKRYAE